MGKCFDCQSVWENRGVPFPTCTHSWSLEADRKNSCVDLGNDFFLIRFQNREDHAQVLREGPWFVGGHYFFIRG